MKKRLELRNFQRLCSMTSTYLGKMCVYFLELFLLKYNKKASRLKIPIIRKRVSFSLNVIFFGMFGGCPFLLNKAPDKVYSKQLRSYDSSNRKKLVDFNK